MSSDVIRMVRSFQGRPVDKLLIQCVDDHDASTLESEFNYIKEHTQASFMLLALKVGSWNVDLSPWKAPAVWGSEGFGDGAEGTLRTITESLIPEAMKGGELVDKPSIYLGGYSLAAFFALWAGYQRAFDGICAASPSVWFPNWMDYARSKAFLSSRCYLSLGKKEEKTRNQVMARVGDCIRSQIEILESGKIEAVLEWNEGNHFTEPDIRTAKGFCWLLSASRM